MLFGIEEEVLKSTNSYNTAKEILQQPRLWKEALNNFEKTKNELYGFYEKIGLNSDFEIIFTGAGTSEYVGNILDPFYKNSSDLNFKSIATTDILNNPLNYLRKDKKVLLVSFARSGDSPESVATVNLVNENCKEAYHLVITCNKNGALAKMAETDENTFVLFMPEESNDKGFAMTSSFSCMLLTGLLAFAKNLEDKYRYINKIIELSENILANKYEKIRELAYQNHERIVILGSGILSGLSQELALKVMELSAGKVVAVNNTTLGFRHGPKAIINDKTIIFELVNEKAYSKQYDRDLIEEMYLDKKADKIVAYCVEKDEKIEEFTHDSLYIDEELDICKPFASIFTYLLYGQMYSFFKSQYLGNTTDNPFPGGDVNRVVKKFQVYDFKA